MEKIKELSGYSGCLVSLYRDKENYFVRKEAKDRSYNKRLEQQIKKQKEYFSIINKPFEVPQILKEGFNSQGLYFVDMEYIEGENYIEYINNLEIEEIKKCALKLIEILKFFNKNKQNETNPNIWEVLFNKINSILREDIDNIKLINYFYNFLADNKNEIGQIKITECHGDMTLENILVNRSGDIYLIDFLDSFCDSVYFDIAKIYQDLNYKWYKIKKNEDISIFDNKISILKKEFDIKIKEEYFGSEKIIKFISLLNLLRILPYTQRDDKRYTIIESIIEKNLSN